MKTQLCTTCNELVPQGCCTCGPRQRLQPLEQSEAVNKHRRLCYGHHCQEFDKLPNARYYEASYWQTVPEAECELCIQGRYDKLVGLTYPDAQGRTITVLDVDESGRALLERDGQTWGCEAEYLADLLPNPIQQAYDLLYEAGTKHAIGSQEASDCYQRAGTLLKCILEATP